MQLTADIFNLPACRPHTYETSGLGAAIDTAVGLGLYGDFDAAIRAMTRVDRVFEPIAAHAGLYDQLYSRVYKACTSAWRRCTAKSVDHRLPQAGLTRPSSTGHDRARQQG